MPTFIPTPRLEGRVRVGAGRRLAFTEYGVPDGRPVLFVPGAASSSAMAFGAADLPARHIRLISVDRPGLGGSDTDPEKTLESVGADLAMLVDTLIGGPVPVVANSQGAPFAIAAALAGAASRLILVSPSDEVAIPAVRAQLPPDFQRLVQHVEAASLADATQLFSHFTPDAFIEMVLNDPLPADAEVYGDPGFVARFRRAVEEAFAQGSEGYARDTALAMSRWPFDLSAVNIPVSILVGSDDVSHSPDQCEALSSRFPEVDRVVVPGAGGSLLWSRPELILDLC